MQECLLLPTRLIAAAMCVKSAENGHDTNAFEARWVVAVVIENDVSVTTPRIKCLSYCYCNADLKFNLSLYTYIYILPILYYYTHTFPSIHSISKQRHLTTHRSSGSKICENLIFSRRCLKTRWGQPHLGGFTRGYKNMCQPAYTNRGGIRPGIDNDLSNDY